MRALLDVNVLIALLDQDHSMHAPALRWFAARAGDGWSSCPITQNGCVRIMSHPNYPNPLKVAAIMERLGEAIATDEHEFWPDDVSLLDSRIADRNRIHGPRQVTDLYLLALAVHQGGCFVSFDPSIPRTAIRGAERKHLIAL
ncbi:MAG: PIN domain-containing protein [Deltaproteobacteria bacterium]|nr:MAG: PIN domain-containing protein [Deltaproteobacteria bacterium]